MLIEVSSPKKPFPTEIYILANFIRFYGLKGKKLGEKTQVRVVALTQFTFFPRSKYIRDVNEEFLQAKQ